MRDIAFRRPNHTIYKLAYILGITSVVSQILILRELIVVFYGNETAYAVVLGSWLFWVAVGSFVLTRIKAVKQMPGIFVSVALWLTAFLLPTIIIAARLLKHSLGFQTGEVIGMMPMCAISFGLLAPLTFLLGAVFTLICQLPGVRREGKRSVSAAGIYLWEAKGAAIGGIVFSFIFIHFVQGFEGALLIALINIYAVVSSVPLKSKQFVAGIIIIAVTVGLFFSGTTWKWDHLSRKAQWQGFDVVKVEDSIYGNIALVKRQGEYSLFENGLLSYSTKDPLTSEENVHYALLSHPHPQSVLLIGGGLTGALKEVLQYNVTSVDYVELDPEVIRISTKYLPEKTLRSLSDKRVNIIYGDARSFLKRTPKKYDVIIVNVGDPYTARVNRYYVLEFFKEAKRALNNGGVLSLSLSSSENYLNQEERSLLRSVHSTLDRVFADNISIPGDTHIFIACTQKGVLSDDPNRFIERLQKRNIKTQYVNAYYLPYKLSEERIAYIRDILRKPGRINTDMHPIAYLYDILLWSTRFNTAFKKMFSNLQWIRLVHLIGLSILLGIIGFAVSRKKHSFPVFLSIYTTGFSEIVFQVIVILAFQSLYSFAYYKVGIIVASFMVGLTLGCIFAQKIISRNTQDVLRAYRRIQLFICLYPLLLPGAFILFRYMVRFKGSGFLSGVFAFLPIIAGFLGGAQYPMAIRLLKGFPQGKEEDEGRFAGALYAVDASGAMLGALVTGVFLIPLLGIQAVAFFCASINIAVLAMFYAGAYPARRSASL